MKKTDTRQFIENFPLFKELFSEKIDELAQLMQEISYKTDDIIVREGDFIDKFFLIVAGKAAVVQKKTFNHSSKDIIVATLQPGDSIGLSAKGIFSETSRRTADVIAMTEMVLLTLDISTFHSFIKKNPAFDKSLLTITEELMKIDFIRQVFPFINLDIQQICSLAQQVEEIILPANTLLFEKGDKADSCYLIRAGEIEVFINHENGSIQQLNILEPPQLLGEAALLTTHIRNASARTLTECNLIVIKNDLLFKAIKNNKTFANSIMGFTVRRFRPLRNKEVIEHRYLTDDNQKAILLQNPRTNRYFRLTEESWFIWEQLDGVQTVHDITLAFHKKYHIFIPDIICNLIFNFSETGFIEIPTLDKILVLDADPTTFFGKLTNKLKGIGQAEFIFSNANLPLTRLYKNVFHFFYSYPAQFALCFLIIFGFISFFLSYERVVQVALHHPPSFWLFLIFLIPINIITQLIHEGGHAFTAKHFGYNIHRMGIGFFWGNPVAFVDISEVWLAKRKIRVAVNIAGVFLETVCAGILVILSFVLSGQWSILLWLYALLVYYSAFRNLSPVREYDGYFLLSDFLRDQMLRKRSIFWLVNILPTTFHTTDMFKFYRREVCYWIACVLYLLISTLIMFFLFQTFFKIFAVDFIFSVPTFYISLTISLSILCLSIYSVGYELAKYS